MYQRTHKATSKNAQRHDTKSHSFFVPSQHQSGQVPTLPIDAPHFSHSFANIPVHHPGSATLIQPKLTIGEPDDKYEREADNMARQVVQRIHEPVPSSERTIQSANGFAQLVKGGLGQRQPSSAEVAVPNVEASIQQAQGGGQSLAGTVQELMQQEFKADFSGVRVHTDARSDQLNRSIQAKAFTTGQDVFFRQGAYQPHSREGQALIAHELTHVVQQNGQAVRSESSPLQPSAGGVTVIQRFVPKDKDGNLLPQFDTNNLDLFQKRLNTLSIVEKNPIVFVSDLIQQIKLEAKKDKKAERALEMCQITRNVLLRGNPEINDLQIEDIISLKEFDDLIRDSQIRDQELVKLVIQVRELAVGLKNNFAAITMTDMSPAEKMQQITRFGDVVMTQVLQESVELYGKPEHGMAVYATGGFGRAETSPGSDLDFGVMGDDREQGLIRALATLMASKINLARGIMAQQLGLPADVKPGFEADPLWLQSPTSVSPEKVAENSAIKGTTEDARLSAALPGSEDLIKRFESARITVRDPDIMWTALSDIPTMYGNLRLESNNVFNIKEPWIRLITLSMQKLGGFLGLKATDTINRIQEMIDKKLLDPTLGQALSQAFMILMNIRQTLHAVYGGEKDEFFIGEAPPPGIEPLSPPLVKDLTSATDTLNQYVARLNMFITTKGKDGLRSATAFEKFKSFF